jgi:predicted RNA-binding Zn ribbon-like protein
MQPILVGGHPALDFLNTLASPQGEPVEFLPDGPALLHWLAASGLARPVEVEELARPFSRRELDAVARRAVALREWLRPIVRRSIEKGAASVAPRELTVLNRALARGTRSLELVRAGGAYAIRRVLHGDSARALLVPVAEAIADLFARADFALVRPCAGAGCTLTFLDRTKAHRRQWCSMAACGNRAKVAAHRERMRE